MYGEYVGVWRYLRKSESAPLQTCFVFASSKFNWRKMSETAAPAFTDTSAQNTELASLEAQEWIEVRKCVQLRTCQVLEVSVCGLDCVYIVYTHSNLVIGGYRKNIFSFFQGISGGWRYTVRVSLGLVFVCLFVVGLHETHPLLNMLSSTG